MRKWTRPLQPSKFFRSPAIKGFFFAVLLLGPSALIADEFYYMIVFAHQGRGNLPRDSHTFATFVKASGEGLNSDDYRTEHSTISWGPLNNRVRVLRLKTQTGKNRSLKRTLEIARGKLITMRGPYRIRKDLYEKAMRRITQLNSGRIRYKVLDRRFRPGAVNCIHGVSDLGGFLDTNILRGDCASQAATRHLHRWIINSRKTHNWILGRIAELKRFPIRSRTLSSCTFR